MRPSKQRRRFHTGRVIRNRQRAFAESGWSRWGREEFHLDNGRLRDRNAYWGCGNARCYLCHSDKFLTPRRAREKRQWQNWESEYK